MPASSEEKLIAEHLSALTEGFPGAHGLTDDCAELTPLPGHALIFKTDPIVAGVHFFPDDPPEALGWKALAVNVSDLAAKAARPVAYLMALTMPSRPEPEWMTAFTDGLRQAQAAFGCVLIGGDTDRHDGPLSIAITVIGEARTGRMVPRRGAGADDLIYVTGELGTAALGAHLRLDPGFAAKWAIAEPDQEAALARYLRPRPRLGLRTALQAHAHSSMDISDGLLKDLDRMCRLTGVGADLEMARLPLGPGVKTICAADRHAGLRTASAGDDYEILACVPPDRSLAFERAARQGGVAVHAIGRVTPESGVRIRDEQGRLLEIGQSGWDHFDR